MPRQVGLILLLFILLSITPSIPLISQPIQATATKTIDGNPSDWTGTPPTTDNTWTYDDTAHEWIWKDAINDQRNDHAQINIDGKEYDWLNNIGKYLIAVDTDPADTNFAGANLSRLFLAWDDDYLYIAIEMYQTATSGWNVDYGIALDTGPGGYTSGTDAYGKNIQFGGDFAPDFEIYIKARGTNIDGVTLHNYTSGSWNWIKDLTVNSEYAFTTDRYNVKFVELKISWNDLRISVPDNISVIAWAAGINPGYSAVDTVPSDPAVTDDSGEWNDADTLTNLKTVQLTIVNRDVDTWSDLVEWRISGDTNNLYMMFKIRNTSGIELGEQGVPYIAVAIDIDREANSGLEWFPEEADTAVSSYAFWEYTLVINLADSRLSGRSYTNSSALDLNYGSIMHLFNNSYTVLGGKGYGAIGLNLDKNTIEVAIPWSVLNFTSPPDNVYLRFTLLTGRGWSNYDENKGGIWEIGDGAVSDAVDVVTDAATTWDEVDDQHINYYVDVYFVNGEPTSPPALLVFEDPSPPDGSILYVGDTVSFKILLTVADSPKEDQSIWVYVNGVNRTDLAGKTNSSGEYSFTLSLDSSLAGSLNVTVHYPGNTSLGSDPANATRIYNVLYRTRITGLELNVTTVTSGSAVTASGTLEYYDGSGWQSLAGETVEIVLVNKSEVLATGTTQSDGSFSIEFTAKYVGDHWEIVAHHPSSGDYDESYSDAVYLDVKGLIDLTTNVNDFPAGSLVYKANDVLVTPTGEPTKDNMSMLYVAWDTSYLYIGVDWAPEEWSLALGIAIDVNPGNASTGYGAVWATNDNTWEDCWRRKINMSTPYLTANPVYPELMVYFWYDGNSITTAQINRYKYESYPPIVGPSYGVQHWEVWEYDYASPQHSPVATNHNGSTLFKIAIPWSVIMNLPNIKYTGKIAIAVWSAHDNVTSAMSVLPMNPTVFDKLGWDELGDNDVIYEFVEITYDQDLDGTPDTGVSAVDRAVFYPSITTSVETDQDTYTVGAGGVFTVKARVVDEYGYYLPVVKVQLYDHNDVKVAEALTGYNDTGFYAELSTVAPTTKGVYTWTVKFIGEAGFTVSTKTITLNVTGLATKILLSWTYSDNDNNNRVSSGDTITLSLTMLYFNPNTSTWEPLGGKTLDLSFNYVNAGITDTDTVTTLSDGTASYTYTVRTITGADVLEITVSFAGDNTYAPVSNSTSIEINLARLIDGVNDWGTGLPRSTPGIAPRGDEIVITDPVNDVNNNAKGRIYEDLDIKEVRITYDGLYIYFYVKFADDLTHIGDLFTVNIVIDATPDNPDDGVDEWFYGVWFTDTKPGGFDPNTGAHIDHWKWTHIIEARPHDGWVDVRALSATPVQTGEVTVNTAGGFVEFKVPMNALPGLDPAAGFRAWIVVFGLNSANPNEYFNPPGSNVIDIASVGDTNAEVLTSRDPDWGNLVWPSEDIWVDQAFLLSFSGPGTPSIPEPDPNTPPTQVVIVYPVAGSAINVSQSDQPLFAVVLVKGTQGRPVALSVEDTGTFYGVVGADDVAVVTYRPPAFNGTYTLTATSDGASDSIRVTYVLQYTLPMPEPPILPLILLAAILLAIIAKRKK